MSLIICPECGKEFSDKAAACPNCGYPINHEDTNEKNIKETIVENTIQQESSQNEPKKNEKPVKKKNSPIAIVAAALILVTFFPLPAFLAFFLLLTAIILCLIDLGIHDKKYTHVSCFFMLIIAIIFFIYVLSAMKII